MDGLTFTSDIIKSLAWPTAVVVIVCVLRKSLIGLIPLIRQLDFKGFGAEFSAKLEKAERAAEQALVSSDEKVAPPKVMSDVVPKVDQDTFLKSLIYNSVPEHAILTQWTRLEHAILQAAQRLNIPHDSRAPLRPLIEQFHDKKLIRPEQVRLISALKELRNLAAHSAPGQIDMSEAARFTFLAEPLINHFTSLGVDPADGSSPKSL